MKTEPSNDKAALREVISKIVDRSVQDDDVAWEKMLDDILQVVAAELERAVTDARIEEVQRLPHFKDAKYFHKYTSGRISMLKREAERLKGDV